MSRITAASPCSPGCAQPSAPIYKTPRPVSSFCSIRTSTPRWPQPNAVRYATVHDVAEGVPSPPSIAILSRRQHRTILYDIYCLMLCWVSSSRRLSARPARLAGAILFLVAAVHGLSPHLDSRPRRLPSARPRDLLKNGQPPLFPAEVPFGDRVLTLREVAV